MKSRECEHRMEEDRGGCGKRERGAFCLPDFGGDGILLVVNSVTCKIGVVVHNLHGQEIECNGALGTSVQEIGCISTGL